MVEQAESSFSSTLKFAENSLKHSGEAASHLYNEVANSLSTDCKSPKHLSISKKTT